MPDRVSPSGFDQFSSFNSGKHYKNMVLWSSFEFISWDMAATWSALSTILFGIWHCSFHVHHVQRHAFIPFDGLLSRHTKRLWIFLHPSNLGANIVLQGPSRWHSTSFPERASAATRLFISGRRHDCDGFNVAFRFFFRLHVSTSSKKRIVSQTQAAFAYLMSSLL